MSTVRESQRIRTEEKFIAINLAETLQKYTYIVLLNEKKFGAPPPELRENASDKEKQKYREQLILYQEKLDIRQKMLDITTDLVICCRNANKIKAYTSNNVKARIMWEEKALRDCASADSILTNIAILFHCASKREEHWRSLIEAVEKCLKGWIKSERIKCVELYNNEKISKHIPSWYDSLVPDFL